MQIMVKPDFCYISQISFCNDSLFDDVQMGRKWHLTFLNRTILIFDIHFKTYKIAKGDLNISNNLMYANLPIFEI